MNGKMYATEKECLVANFGGEGAWKKTRKFHTHPNSGDAATLWRRTDTGAEMWVFCKSATDDTPASYRAADCFENFFYFNWDKTLDTPAHLLKLVGREAPQSDTDKKLEALRKAAQTAIDCLTIDFDGQGLIIGSTQYLLPLDAQAAAIKALRTALTACENGEVGS